MRNGLIVLSAIVGLAIRTVRRGGRDRPFPEGLPGSRGSPLRRLALPAAVAAAGLLFRQLAPTRATKCRGEAQTGIRRCARYEDQGYHACGRYEEGGYHACSRYEDRGYNACSRYEDRGYNACSKWKKNCCTWWPCSWVCEVFSWFCVAWVWISNLVCVAWTWISHLVCIAWVWISHLVCTLWVWVTNLVCVAWYWVTFPYCILACLLRRWFTGNEVSQARSECIYGWTAAYRITEQRDCVLAIVLRIRLQPDAGVTQRELQAAQATWEQAIEQAWTGRFPIRRTNGDCACAEYRVTLDVQWVTSGEHHTVRVRTGSGRADMTNWFITSTGGTAAHEAGHMLGNPDEYPDDACPDRAVSNDGSIMRSSQTGTVRPRHYQGFADWISARTCCDYAVAE